MHTGDGVVVGQLTGQYGFEGVLLEIQVVLTQVVVADLVVQVVDLVARTLVVLDEVASMEDVEDTMVMGMFRNIVTPLSNVQPASRPMQFTVIIVGCVTPLSIEQGNARRRMTPLSHQIQTQKTVKLGCKAVGKCNERGTKKSNFCSTRFK